MGRGDSVGSDIDDLKEDLADALKENERLQAELAEAYNVDSDDERERELVSSEEFEALKTDAENSRLELSRLQADLHSAQAYYSASGLDLIKALAMVEIIVLNGAKSWEYFKTMQGKGELEWAHTKYKTEMEKIFNEHGRLTS